MVEEVCRWETVAVGPTKSSGPTLADAPPQGKLKLALNMLFNILKYFVLVTIEIVRWECLLCSMDMRDVGNICEIMYVQLC